MSVGNEPRNIFIMFRYFVYTHSHYEVRDNNTRRLFDIVNSKSKSETSKCRTVSVLSNIIGGKRTSRLFNRERNVRQPSEFHAAEVQFYSKVSTFPKRRLSEKSPEIPNFAWTVPTIIFFAVVNCSPFRRKSQNKSKTKSCTRCKFLRRV